MQSKYKQSDFQSFEEFYPFYLSQHANMTNRKLHAVGTFLSLLITLFGILTAQPHIFFYAMVTGYGFAWVGHFFFEKNKPATFKYPVYSLIGDFVMMKDILTRKIKV